MTYKPVTEAGHIGLLIAIVPGLLLHVILPDSILLHSKRRVSRNCVNRWWSSVPRGHWIGSGCCTKFTSWLEEYCPQRGDCSGMPKAVRLYQERAPPATTAVCILEESISDGLMQNIAAEMNLSETAFVRRLPSAAEGEYSLRWFTPMTEVPLCGHATVATAAALLEGEGVQCSLLRFQTLHCGVLTVSKTDGLYHLSVPLLPPGPPSYSVSQPCDAISKVIMNSLSGASCLYVGHNMKTKKVFMALEGLTRELFQSWNPPIAQLKGIPSSTDILSVIVSCAGGKGEAKLLVRFFAPWAGIDEDPVTGSAYAVAGPWWASRLGKTSFAARQCSKRGGDLHITVREADGKVDVAGGAVVVSEGRLFLD